MAQSIVILFLLIFYSCSTIKQDKKIITELDVISRNALNHFQDCFDNTGLERRCMDVEFDVACLQDDSLLVRNIGLTDALPSDAQNKIQKCLNDKNDLLKSREIKADSCIDKNGDRNYQVRATIFPVKIKTIFNSRYKFIFK